MAQQKLELRAEPRTVVGKHVKYLREQGVVPANVYGHGSSRAIQAPERAIELVLAHGGRGRVVTLLIDGAGAAGQPALVKHYVRDAKSGRLQHVDFQAVSMSEKVTSATPLRFVGEAPAVKLGGVLTHPVTDVKVEAVASALPEAIEVDLSGLTEFGAGIRVADLTPPSGVHFLDAPETLVAHVTAPAVAVEEAPAEEGAAAPEAPAAAAQADATPEGESES